MEQHLPAWVPLNSSMPMSVPFLSVLLLHDMAFEVAIFLLTYPSRGQGWLWWLGQPRLESWEGMEYQTP
jgi:hypothetical protein